MTVHPKGGTAVMAHRLGREIEHVIPHLDQWRELDLFPTPPWGTRAFFKHVLPALRIRAPIGTVWEPAAGFGHMSEPLRPFALSVLATDIHPYGYHLDAQMNFLSADPRISLADWVMTNPPFDHAEEFLQMALQVARKGVAFLVRLSWLESQGRYKNLWTKTPPTVVAVFTERLPMCLGGWDPEQSSATAYAWFVWLRDENGDWPVVVDDPFFIPTFLIPPGCRQSLTIPSDSVLARRHVESWISPTERKKLDKLRKSLLDVTVPEEA